MSVETLERIFALKAFGAIIIKKKLNPIKNFSNLKIGLTRLMCKCLHKYTYFDEKRLEQPITTTTTTRNHTFETVSI